MVIAYVSTDQAIKYLEIEINSPVATSQNELRQYTDRSD